MKGRGIMKTTETISFKEKFCYGLGDVSGNLTYMLISSYLLYFYTDVAGIAVGTVGIFMAVVRTIDSVANPLIGFAVDRTNTRFGKIRPYLLLSNLPLAILLAAVFAAPNLSETGKVAYAFGSFLLYSLTYSFSNTPYSALSTNMTDREDERLTLSKYRTIGMSVGCFAVTLATLPLVRLTGGGNDRKGFFWMAVIFAVVSAVSMHLCFQHTRERICPPPPKEGLPLTKAVRYAFQSKPWVILCALQSLSMASFTIREENTVYFCKYILNNREISSVLLTVSPIITLTSAFFLPKPTATFGKQRLLFFGYGLNLLSLGGIALMGTHTAGVIFFHTLAALGTGCSTGLFFVMISETIDHSEWQCGVRQQGLLASLLMLVVKLFCMVMSFCSAQILDLAGYREGMEATPAVLGAIRTNFLFLPMGLAVIFLICCRLYRLEEDYPRILEELHRRRESDAQR